MSVLQLDAIPVVTRSHYLPFLSRLGPYRPALLDETAYAHDEWFEAWAHEASLLPVESEPLLRWQKERARQGDTWKMLDRVAREEPGYVATVFEEVRARGPLAARDLSDARSDDAHTIKGWGRYSLGSLALEWLFRTGQVGIRRRPNFEKVYAPIGDIVPAEILARPTPDEVDAQRELTRQALCSLGVGTLQDIADYFRLRTRDVRPRLEELVEAGEVVPASVQGWDRDAFADARARIPRAVSGQAVLSPFDPVVWCRDRAERLFGFHYRIEIYVPRDQRRWGYYVLPVLADSQLVARLDVKTNRDAGALVVKAAHTEGHLGDAETADRVASALCDLATFLGVGAVEVEPTGDLAPALSDCL